MVQLMEKPLDLSPPPPPLPHSAACCPPPLPPPFFSPSPRSSSLSSQRFLPIFVWLEPFLFLLTLQFPRGELHRPHLPKATPSVATQSPGCRGPSPAAKMTRNGVKPQIGARNRAPARLEVEMPAARHAPRRPRISLLHFYRPFSFFSPFFKPRAPLVVCFSPSRSPHTGGDPRVPAIGVRPPRGTLLLAGRFGDLGTCLGFAAFS